MHNHWLLIFAYSFPVAMLVWLWLAGNARPLSKWSVTLLLPILYLLHWQALQDYAGWPANGALPEEFELITANVTEPRPEHQIKGAVHLLIRPHSDATPRLFELAYSRELHRMLHETKIRSDAGIRQIGYLRSAEAQGVAVNQAQNLEFKDAERLTLPPK